MQTFSLDTNHHRITWHLCKKYCTEKNVKSPLVMFMAKKNTSLAYQIFQSKVT